MCFYYLVPPIIFGWAEDVYCLFPVFRDHFELPLHDLVDWAELGVYVRLLSPDHAHSREILFGHGGIKVKFFNWGLCGGEVLFGLPFFPLEVSLCLLVDSLVGSLM